MSNAAKEAEQGREAASAAQQELKTLEAELKSAEQKMKALEDETSSLQNKLRAAEVATPSTVSRAAFIVLLLLRILSSSSTAHALATHKSCISHA
jgi:uncharacterized protein YlxW (UPF0749 family)